MVGRFYAPREPNRSGRFSGALPTWLLEKGSVRGRPAARSFSEFLTDFFVMTIFFLKDSDRLIRFINRILLKEVDNNVVDDGTGEVCRWI